MQDFIQNDRQLNVLLTILIIITGLAKGYAYASVFLIFCAITLYYFIFWQKKQQQQNMVFVSFRKVT